MNTAEKTGITIMFFACSVGLLSSFAYQATHRGMFSDVCLLAFIFLCVGIFVVASASMVDMWRKK